MRFRFLTKISFCALALMCASTLHAQFAPKQQPIIDAVKIQFTNFKTVSDEAIEAHIRLRPGQPYDTTLADQSIHSLYKTKLFEFITIRLDDAPSGNKIAVFEITSKYRISELTFEGASKYKSKRLQKEIKSAVGQSLDGSQLKMDANTLIDYYQKKGYSKIKVTFDVKRDPETGEATVVFHISEGPKITISKIIFEGNEDLKQEKLRDVMKTKRWNILSFFTGAGIFKDEQFYDDLDSIREYCKNQGYLDVQLNDADVTFEYPSESRMVIVIKLNLGRRYYIGNIKISNNKLFPEDKLMKALTIKTGDVFSPEVIDENAETLRGIYGQVGYLDTYAIPERIPNLKDGTIDLNFVVHESDKFFVESVVVEGNTKTKSTVIIREIALAPGDVFDLIRMKNSQLRLQNTRYFDEVNLMPEATNIPGRRKLRIAVKEAKTASINFGVGLSNIEKFTAFAEYSQTNFDIFNYRNWFQGAGQKFRVRFSIGSRSNDFLLYFEEPWLFERELTFGFELFRNESRYTSSLYNEVRMGFEVFFRKRLFELVEGRVFYHLESVRIFNLAQNVSPLIRSEKGYRSISKVGFTALRDTRDNLIYPTEGSRLEAGTELAGGPVGGQTKYVNLFVRGAQFFPTFETGEQVLSILGRTGTIMGYGGQSVPFFERYYMGGPDDLRGFGYRKVGPRDSTGESIGGKTMAYGSIEYTVRVMEPVRIAAFYDIGFLNKGELNWNPNGYRDDWGFGLRIFMLGAPLRVDLAFPITRNKKRTSGKPEFNFSFGARF